jgi:hypothetical protein
VMPRRRTRPSRRAPSPSSCFDVVVAVAVPVCVSWSGVLVSVSGELKDGEAEAGEDQDGADDGPGALIVGRPHDGDDASRRARG